VDDRYLQTNRDLWDFWTELHTTVSEEYLEAMAQVRAGGTTLDDIVLSEVGDVAGRSLLHLQCHLGLDTLSWASMGAEATGVDFSESSVAAARRFGREVGLAATFVCADIYDLPTVLDQKYDFIFTSDGVWPWLPDLDRWAKIAAGCLRPGGVFYIRDIHPIRRVLKPPRPDAFGAPVEIGYVAQPEPVRFEERGSYSVPEHDSVHTAYYWQHGLGEIVTALCSAGLRLEFLHEFSETEPDVHVFSRAASGRLEAHLRHNVTVPRQFSIRAVRQEGAR
jgi:SAM-dependent methyltransferase